MNEQRQQAESNAQESVILDFWKKNKMYEKSKKKNAQGRKFYFMDGPPYASGSIHLGTALNKILKDIAMRSQRLQGKDVFDRPGYDAHGVPIEYQIEKEFKIKTKQDIERYGVAKFVAKCKEFATRYIDLMNAEFQNLGVWMDWENPYVTLTNEYVEAIWHAFKEADKKGLLYRGKYSVHVCTRCATAVAYNEIVYARQKDTAIFVKFPVIGKKGTFLLLWTTTPWTLPGNAAVMVHPDVLYQEVRTAEGEHWILAKERVEKVMAMLEQRGTIIREFKGRELESCKYENPVARHTRLHVKKGYRVVLAPRYVTTEEGTGLVHCAPGHGKEDYDVGKSEGLDMPCPVEITGVMTSEAGKYAGKKAREVDAEIIEDLQKDGFLVYKHTHEHDYPLCWRDKTPLLMLALPQWFLKISGIQQKLLRENEQTQWSPAWAQLRMKAWLEGIGDWPVSRARYWGTPLPIWYNEETEERIVVGSVAELEKLSGMKVKELHKPAIDDIIIRGKNGTVLRRVREVLDVWFDSGVSSWAALGYPSHKSVFKKIWPADLNIEGKDQIRGWWNSQLILSEIAFGKKPFDSIVMHGMVLDVSKRKMSKSQGNIVTPAEVIAAHGRDALRYYFAKLSKGEDFAFDEREMREIQRMFMMLRNVSTFVNQLDNIQKSKNKASDIEDQWIISRYHTLIQNVMKAYNAYHFYHVVAYLEHFLMFDLSRTYIQMIRERADEVAPLLHEVRNGLLVLSAPLIPFLTEIIWQELRAKKMVKDESVHLALWPKADKKKIDAALENQFAVALRLIEAGMAARDAAKIGLRWPLASSTITMNETLSKDMQEIIARQLNVRRVMVKKGKTHNVSLDTALTAELEAEGFAREVARKIQAERKNAGLEKGDMIALEVFSDAAMKVMLERNQAFLQQRTNAKTLIFSVFPDGNMPKAAIVFTVRERKIGIKIS